MNNPLVSVLIPCYNQGEYLGEALDSLIAQTFPNWEAWVVSDGSTDSTEEVALEYASCDSRIHYLYQENAGPAAARNNGAAHSTGKYLLPLDEDDKLADTYIEKGVTCLENDDECALFYTKTQYFGALNNISHVPPYSDYKEFLAHNCIFATAMFRKSDFDSIGGYDDSWRIGLEDWEMFIRLLYPGKKVQFCDEVLFFYRKNPQNVTRTTNVISHENEIIWKIYTKHRDKVFEFYGNPLERVHEYAWTKRKPVQWAYYWCRRYDHFVEKWRKYLHLK